MKQLLYKLAMQVLVYCLDYAYNYVDKNKDGKLDKAEIKALYDLLNEKVKLIRKMR